MKKKLQIFVSSTYTDLIEERQAAVEAILRAGHIPAGMELFAAGSESQLEIIKRWIDDSDIYMLLIGGRYGSVETNEQLGYTEIEYRYALETGKPIFAIILSDDFINEKVKNVGMAVFEQTEQAKLKAFRAFVATKISRFVDDKKDIKVAVLESLLDIQSRYTLSGWVKSDQIPDVGELINQIKELKEKNNELENKITIQDIRTPNKIGDYSYDELKHILSQSIVKIPTKLTDEINLFLTIFDLAMMFQAKLSSGVNNSAGSTPLTSFLYHTVCPRLRIYELAEIVKVTGVTWQINQTSKLGNRFIALANMKGDRPITSVIMRDGKFIRNEISE